MTEEMRKEEEGNREDGKREEQGSLEVAQEQQVQQAARPPTGPLPA